MEWLNSLSLLIYFISYSYEIKRESKILIYSNKKMVVNLNKRGIKGLVSEYLPWILIAVAVLVILVIASITMKDKGISLIDYLRNITRFR